MVIVKNNCGKIKENLKGKLKINEVITNNDNDFKNNDFKNNGSKIYFYLFEYNILDEIKDLIKIYNKTKRKILDDLFEIYVIGQSHCISAKKRNFLELFSCEKISNQTPLFEIDLNDKKIEKLNCTFKFAYGLISIKIIKFESSYINKKYDFSYFFSNESFTGITYLEDGYETFHSYIEFDLIIVTKTKFNKNRK